MKKEEVASLIGQRLRGHYGPAFGLVCESSGSVVLFVGEFSPRKLSRAEWEVIREAMVEAAARDLKIPMPTFSDRDWPSILSAASWNCRLNRECRSCMEKKVLAISLHGLTIDEFLQSKGRKVA